MPCHAMPCHAMLCQVLGEMAQNGVITIATVTDIGGDAAKLCKKATTTLLPRLFTPPFTPLRTHLRLSLGDDHAARAVRAQAPAGRVAAALQGGGSTVCMRCQAYARLCADYALLCCAMPTRSRRSTWASWSSTFPEASEPERRRCCCLLLAEHPPPPIHMAGTCSASRSPSPRPSSTRWWLPKTSSPR